MPIVRVIERNLSFFELHYLKEFCRGFTNHQLQISAAFSRKFEFDTEYIALIFLFFKNNSC